MCSHDNITVVANMYQTTLTINCAHNFLQVTIRPITVLQFV